MYATTLPTSNWLRRASIRLAWYRHMPASSLLTRSGARGDLCHVMPCWPWFVHWLSAWWTGLLQLRSRWYLWPAARPIAVRLECRRPFGFLSEAVRTHNPHCVVSSICCEFRNGSHSAVRSSLPLPSRNSAGHLMSTLDAVCALLTQTPGQNATEKKRY